MNEKSWPPNVLEHFSFHEKVRTSDTLIHEMIEEIARSRRPGAEGVLLSFHEHPDGLWFDVEHEDGVLAPYALEELHHYLPDFPEARYIPDLETGEGGRIELHLPDGVVVTREAQVHEAEEQAVLLLCKSLLGEVFDPKKWQRLERAVIRATHRFISTAETFARTDPVSVELLEAFLAVALQRLELTEGMGDPQEVWHWRAPDMTIACADQGPNENATTQEAAVSCLRCIDTTQLSAFEAMHRLAVEVFTLLEQKVLSHEHALTKLRELVMAWVRYHHSRDERLVTHDSPDDEWREFEIWRRFPDGMNALDPASLRVRVLTLIHDYDRRRVDQELPVTTALRAE